MFLKAKQVLLVMLVAAFAISFIRILYENEVSTKSKLIDDVRDEHLLVTKIFKRKTITFEVNNTTTHFDKVTKLTLERERKKLNAIYNDCEPELQKYLSNITKKVNILLWNPPFWITLSKLQQPESRCGPCQFISNKTKINESTTKGVLFYYQDLELEGINNTRRPDQYYIWWTQESPKHVRDSGKIQLADYDNFFNLTMTYRRDSDVVIPYDTMSSVFYYIQNNPTLMNFNSLFNKKTKLAVWIVSNCNKTDGAKTRMQIIKEMIKEGFEIEIRGKCNPELPIIEKDNVYSFISQYKFYMAFENNYHCKDYITEKFFRNGLLSGALPVVWGSRKADYLKVAPPNSFIHVHDFKSIPLLVKYLKYLDQDETAYKQYFKWRYMKEIDMPDYYRGFSFCQICRIMHGINIDNLWDSKYNASQSKIPLFGYPKKPRIVKSLANWFYGTNQEEC